MSRSPSNYLCGPSLPAPCDIDVYISLRNRCEFRLKEKNFFPDGPKGKTEDPKPGRSQSVCSITNSCTSSGRTSPSSLPSDVMSALDSATFSLKLEGNAGKKSTKRYSPESFAKKTDLNLDGFNTDSDDPLSRLDPLWTMKK